MVWAWVLCLPYALEPRTLLRSGHGCSGYRMLSNHECYYGLGMGALFTVCSRTTLWSGHGCSGDRMLLKHERYHGLGMDALVTVRSRTTNVTMVWAWVLWLPHINMYVHVHKYIYIYMCVYMHICILYITEQNPGILMELYP